VTWIDIYSLVITAQPLEYHCYCSLQFTCNCTCIQLHIVFMFNVFMFNVFMFNVFMFNVFMFNVFMFNVFMFNVFMLVLRFSEDLRTAKHL
jgi:hypothetical protein